eukprot:gene14303-biopygen14745
MASCHYHTLIDYLKHRHKHGAVNPYYPCFAMCSAKPPDRQKFHPVVIVSVDHRSGSQYRYQVFFDTADSHNTAHTDTYAVIIDPAEKAMLLAIRDSHSDTEPSELPDDVFMHEPDPTTLGQADISPNRAHWYSAIQSEIDGILEPERSTPVTSFPPDAMVLPTKLVFKLKKLPDGTIDKFKVRLTSKGDMDRKYYDERDTFAPTPQLSTFRLLMALCCLHHLMPYHYDVSQAFLQALIPEGERYTDTTSDSPRDTHSQRDT